MLEQYTCHAVAVLCAWALRGEPADASEGRQVMGGLETRMDETGDSTPLTGDRPGDIECIDGIGECCVTIPRYGPRGGRRIVCSG
jgi:hypothetical protein